MAIKIFKFHNHPLKAHYIDNQIWFESADIAKALGYSNPKAVTGLYARYKKEFEGGMSKVLDSSTSANLKARKRIFSLRGVHLIAMFARTPVAEDFRKWVLDLLDKEVKPTVKSRGPYKNRKSELPCGVYHHQSKYNPYRAYAWNGESTVYVGCFPTVDDAVAAIEHFRTTATVQRLPASEINITGLVPHTKDLSTNAAVSADGTHLIAPSDMVDHFAVLLEAAQFLACYKHGKDLAWELVAFTQETAKGSASL
ncbi:BRO-N domain-containing protein [Limnobaculum xujianqingii]|uniref:BRO-N domain-containing protein n=1 Tax=Limnobaculum xujianqingii TaxID=2738837 RepID=UPI0015B94F77|nr:BRO family protein [Limnobaculum xujianqingii]